MFSMASIITHHLLAEPPVAVLVFLRMDFVLLRIALEFYHFHLKQAADLRYRVKVFHVFVVDIFHGITLLAMIYDSAAV